MATWPACLLDISSWHQLLSRETPATVASTEGIGFRQSVLGCREGAVVEVLAILTSSLLAASLPESLP